jgi:hypothetical protein
MGINDLPADTQAEAIAPSPIRIRGFGGEKRLEDLA